MTGEVSSFEVMAITFIINNSAAICDISKTFYK